MRSVLSEIATNLVLLGSRSTAGLLVKKWQDRPEERGRVYLSAAKNGARCTPPPAKKNGEERGQVYLSAVAPVDLHWNGAKSRARFACPPHDIG